MKNNTLWADASPYEKAVAEVEELKQDNEELRVTLKVTEMRLTRFINTYHVKET